MDRPPVLMDRHNKYYQGDCYQKRSTDSVHSSIKSQGLPSPTRQSNPQSHVEEQKVHIVHQPWTKRALLRHHRTRLRVRLLICCKKTSVTVIKNRIGSLLKHSRSCPLLIWVIMWPRVHRHSKSVTNETCTDRKSKKWFQNNSLVWYKCTVF